MSTRKISSSSEFNDLVGSIKDDDVIICNMWAKWCVPCNELNSTFDSLSSFAQNNKQQNKNNKMIFVSIDVDLLPDIAKSFDVNSVPTFLFLKGGKDVSCRIEGALPAQLAETVDKFIKGEELPASTPQSLDDRLKSLVNSAPNMLFMKGSPDMPKCGFSSQAVNLLRSIGVNFSSFDILSDEEVRQGLKEYSNWPTYPQLYSKGNLVGGLDVMKEMHSENELKDALS